ncbi:MAG: glutamine--fructose-6-phosphate transaminase (isomerizing) [Candidatus Eremiobacteraeota bacterium]|nr:glutamine--fructose-6-phosphate transaminase (isomerizing) [Candidatus Eremiobacteraeota bacterium]
MCGIVGYIGNKEAVPVLMNGLKRLEYRGYDSAGIAVLHNGKLRELKSVGKLSRLESLLNENPIYGHTGIGHTRWATHGKPSDDNAHPHSDCNHEIAVVHNGIIENYVALKNMLISEGHKFISETDTEILAHLIEKYFDGDLLLAVRAALKNVEGSFAIGVICTRQPDRIVAARRHSPLVLGLGDGENILASDIPAFLPYTKEALLINDDELVLIKKDSVEISTLSGEPVEREGFQILWDAKMAEKGGYKHFMLKEIFEQPHVVADTLAGRLTVDYSIDLSETELPDDLWTKIDKVFIVACGTAYHAGMVGKYLLEEIARLPVEVDLASEFRYRNPIVDKNSLVLAISQSGETADTLAAAREARGRGACLLSICNVMGSSLTRESDGVLYTRAGIEVGVAATKTFIAQLTALYLIAYHAGYIKGHVNKEKLKDFCIQIRRIPRYIDQILTRHEEIKSLARLYYNRTDFLYLGRNIQFPIALEGALKLKEISYIHAEGYAAGEMKHGPIALIDENVPVLAVAPQGPTYEKIISNIKEVKARDAESIGIVTEEDDQAEQHFDHLFAVPKTPYLMSPLLTTIPLQLLAYYIADRKGTDVDQPRNLAKSVTVE